MMMAMSGPSLDCRGPLHFARIILKLQVLGCLKYANLHVLGEALTSEDLHRILALAMASRHD
jgi:hypothetical protein